MVLKQLFFSKNYEKLPSGWGLCPQTPVNDTFELQSLLYSTRLPIKTFSHFNFWFKPSRLNEFLVTCQLQTTAFDLPFYDISAPTKNSFFEVFDDVIVCDLWFGAPPNQKSRLRLCRTCTPITDYFHDKTKISKENLWVDYYLLLKSCHRQCTLLSPTWTKSLSIKI